MISSYLLQLTVLMSLLALSFERPLAGYNYQVPDNPLVLPKRRTTTQSSTTTTSKPPEEGGTYNYPVPEDSLILPTKNTPSSSATDKKQAKKTSFPQPKKTVPAGEGKEKRTETTTKKSYDYPVPENPLTLPPPQTKKPESTTSVMTTTQAAETTETISTEKTAQPSIETTEIPDKEIGYEYPTPENPLNPGTSAELPPCQVGDSDSVDLKELQTPGVDCLEDSSQNQFENTETNIEVEYDENLEEGYQYPIPENSLKPVKNTQLPPCKLFDSNSIDTRESQIPGVDCLAEESSQNQPQNTDVGNQEGYQYPAPENPWTPYEKLPECNSEIEKEIRELMNTIGTDLLGLAMHIELVADNCEEKDTSENNQIDLRTVNGLENDQILDCSNVYQQELQEVMKTIGTDFYGLAKFAQSCSEKAKVVPEDSQLPPCPANPIDDFSIDLRSQDQIIPGVTCKELPPCPVRTAVDITSTDLIPGVTCKELPPCPVTDYALGLIQDLTQEDIVPGVTCRELLICPPYEERDSKDILGVTCKPLPPCPVIFDDIPDLDIRTGNADQVIPGVTCENLPPCPISEETNSVPGLTCRILPLCPILDLTEYEDSNEYFIPGVTCQPRPDIFGLENENFRVDLSELPDFSPDYYLEESARGSFDNVPGSISIFLIIKVLYFETYLPTLKSYPHLISVPLTTPSTPIKDNDPNPKDQQFARVFVLEPVIVRPCHDMASQASQEEGSNDELPNPGVNCDLENIEGASSSAIGLNGLDWPIGPTGPSSLNSPIVFNVLNGPQQPQIPAAWDPESEDLLQEFTILLPVSSETLPSTLPEATVVKEIPTPTLLGLDFNLATGGFFQVSKSA